MNPFDADGLFDTDVAALRGLRGLEDNSPCAVVTNSAGRTACDTAWARIHRELSPLLAEGSTADAAQRIGALNQERGRLQTRINELLAQRPDIRALAPTSLMSSQPGEPPPANLQTIRAITRRLRRAAAVLEGLAAVPASGGGGGGGGGGGSSGGGGGGSSGGSQGTSSIGAEVTALNQAGAQLQGQINQTLAARPALRASAPADLMREGPNEVPRGTITALRAKVARLRQLVAWLQAQPATPTPTSTTTTIAATPTYYAPVRTQPQVVYARPATRDLSRAVGPQWGNTSPWSDCPHGPGLGSWLSSAFKSVTGSSLSSAMPAIGGIVGSIVPGVGTVIGGAIGTAVGALTSGQGSAGDAIGTIMGSLSPQAQTAAIAAVAAGAPCKNVSSAFKAQCQLEVAKLRDELARKWGITATGNPCLHLPAQQRVTCQGQRRQGFDLIAAAYAAGLVPKDSPVAALTTGPQNDADRAVASTSTSTAKSSTSSIGGLLPLALGAAALLLMGGG